jgi:hypothetical protein
MTSARASTSTEVFTQRSCHPSMNPKGVSRESLDSESHPNSVGVILALDVSGSMGEIPRKLATDTLPAFMQAMLDSGVRDPQILFMAIGNADSDSAPLQVGQFESTESLMDQWLTRMYLEGGGAGGNENYELAMYFAARHTVMDGLTKRHRRGYLFMTGDEPPNPVVSKEHVRRLIGDTLPADLPIEAVIAETMKSWEPFYLIPDPTRAQAVERDWRNLLGDRVIVMPSPQETGYVAAGLVSLLEGGVADLGELAARLGKIGLDRQRTAGICHALTPFAASLGKDGVPGVKLTRSSIPKGNGPSGYDR